jgi:hypothetical protein
MDQQTYEYMVKLMGDFVQFFAGYEKKKSLTILDEVSETLNNGVQIITLCFPMCSDLHFRNMFSLHLILLSNQLTTLNIHKHWH